MKDDNAEPITGSDAVGADPFNVRQVVHNDLPIASAEFIGKFAALSTRLASFGVQVHTADLQWGHFGCFILMVMKREEAVRFTYDGRDSFITVDASPVRQHSYPNQWEQLVVKGIGNQHDEVIEFVEEFLRIRFVA